MQTIIAQSIPLKEVIQDLANEMKTSFSHRCDEYQLNIPKELGEGSIKGIDFNNGMGLIFYDCTFSEDMEIQFIIDKTHPLKFIFCENGILTHRFEHETQIHKVSELQNIIVASNAMNGHIIRFNAGMKTVINSLEINRAVFHDQFACEFENWESDVLKNLFNDITAKEEFYHHGNYSTNIADLFSEIENFSKENFLRRIFLEGSAFRVLILQILQYLDDLDISKNKSILRKFEFKLVQEAANLIKNEILNFKTVQELALHVGLNSNKLQEGFRQLYGMTVNAYVHEHRLDLANNLIKNSEHTISEIVDMIGLSSKSYFSKIFKEKYGISPSLLRQNRNQTH